MINVFKQERLQGNHIFFLKSQGRVLFVAMYGSLKSEKCFGENIPGWLKGDTMRSHPVHSARPSDDGISFFLQDSFNREAILDKPVYFLEPESFISEQVAFELYIMQILL